LKKILNTALVARRRGGSILQQQKENTKIGTGKQSPQHQGLSGSKERKRRGGVLRHGYPESS